MQQSCSTKGFISNCYAMLLGVYLESFPSTACERWEADVSEISGNQREESLEAVQLYSLNVSQRLYQLYKLKRVHCTPLKLHSMDLYPDHYLLDVTYMQGTCLHLLWRCPKVTPILKHCCYYSKYCISDLHSLGT